MTILGRTGAALAAAVLMATTSACGGDDSGDPGATATVTVTATPTTSESAATDPSGAVTSASAPTASAATVSVPGDDLSTPPTSYVEAIAHIKAAQDVTDDGAQPVSRFTSPSGNIYCAINEPDQYAACEIEQGKVDDASACPGQQQTTEVGRLEIQGNQAVAVCNTDTIVQPGAVVLAYGTSAAARDTRCVSEEIGMTCISRGAPTGFFLAEGAFTLLDQ